MLKFSALIENLVTEIIGRRENKGVGGLELLLLFLKKKKEKRKGG